MDQLQKRDLAMRKYQAVVATNSGNAEADRARKRIKNAYREIQASVASWNAAAVGTFPGPTSYYESD